jgi:hypothetical protein
VIYDCVIEEKEGIKGEMGREKPARFDFREGGHWCDDASWSFINLRKFRNGSPL